MDDSSFNKDDRKIFCGRHDGIKRGRVGENLISCVVGETLARNIWKTTSENSPRRQPTSLELFSNDSNSLGSSDKYNGLFCF